MSLTLNTAPTTEPVSVAELKLAARIDSSDEDPLLSGYISAARQQAEEYTRRAFITQRWKLTLDLPNSQFANVCDEGVYHLPITALSEPLPRVLRLPKPALLSVISITTYDLDNVGTVFSSSNYGVDTAGGRIFLNQDAYWPSNMRNIAAVEIIFSAGYGDSAGSVPAAIRNAIMMAAQRMYDSRIICDLPAECIRLLQPYRVMDQLAYA
jgi:hypothetical protein